MEVVQWKDKDWQCSWKCSCVVNVKYALTVWGVEINQGIHWSLLLNPC